MTGAKVPSRTEGTKPRLRSRLRPWWHRAIGAGQVIVGVASIIVNYVDYGRTSLLPGGHQELYFVAGLLVAGSSIWWFGWFDRQPSPEAVRAAFEQARHPAKGNPANPQRSSSSGKPDAHPTPSSGRRTKG